MIVDASAVLAILLGEPEARAFADRLADVERPRISVVNYFEVAVRIDRLEDALARSRFDAFAELVALQVEPVTLGQGRIARRAFEEFGKRRHRAALNLGDCFAYALSKETGLPLLFKGDDFVHTDVDMIG